MLFFTKLNNFQTSLKNINRLIFFLFLKNNNKIRNNNLKMYSKSFQRATVYDPSVPAGFPG